jgi:hypothetical protein
MKALFPIFVVALAMLAAPAARASVQVIGGSDLLTTPQDLTNVENWLGQGSITLTNVFDHAAGDGKTSANFHAAVDGKGPTITLIQVLSGSGYHYDTSTGVVDYPAYSIGPQIVGGYNPQSWSSIGNYNYTPADVDRTAFIFNLTDAVKQSQKLSSDPSGSLGVYQTYNYLGYGPTFGGGFDILVQGNLSDGYAASHSYGSGLHSSTNPDDILIEIGHNNPGDYSYGILNYGAIEVFTISPLADGAVVPEPYSFAIWTALSGAVSAVLCCRRKANRE